MLNVDSNYSLIAVGEPFVDKIKSFLTLPEGWNYGAGIPPDAKTIEKALEIATYAYNNFLLIDSAPGLEGEVQIALYCTNSKEDQYLECTFEKYGPFNITLYKKQQNKWSVIKDLNLSSLDSIKTEIDNFVKEIFICLNISEYSPKNNISGPWEDFPAWRSEISKVEYQLYENHAYQTPEVRYAGT